MIILRSLESRIRHLASFARNAGFACQPTNGVRLSAFQRLQRKRFPRGSHVSKRTFYGSPDENRTFADDSSLLQKKPYSAVTVTIENLTGERYEEDDLSGIPELVEVIGLQGTGPSEAARAIRKKLKYGSVHRQIRALVILDGLIQNAGPRFQRAFADEPLLERLRVCGTSDLSDPDVKNKCRELFRQWAQYANTAGLQQIARLHKVRELAGLARWD